MTIDLSKITAIEFEDVDWRDYPDFCDAHIVKAEIDGRELTQEEIDYVNEQSEFVLEKLHFKLF
jgi:hypothetical protein